MVMRDVSFRMEGFFSVVFPLVMPNWVVFFILLSFRHGMMSRRASVTSLLCLFPLSSDCLLAVNFISAYTLICF